MRSAALLKQDTDNVRRTNDIVAVIGEYVRLKRAGAAGRHVGLCPFHKEKTPSLTVNTERQRFKCFGCGAGGDVFEFVQRIEGVGFQRAKEALASRAGVELAEQLTPAEKREYARRRAAAEPLAAELARAAADWADGLDRFLVRHLESRGKLTAELLSLDVDPGNLLIDARRRVSIVREARPDSLIRAFRATPEPERRHFLEAGRADRKNAEAVTRAIVDLLAQAEQRRPLYKADQRGTL